MSDAALRRESRGARVGTHLGKPRICRECGCQKTTEGVCVTCETWAHIAATKREVVRPDDDREGRWVRSLEREAHRAIAEYR